MPDTPYTLRYYLDDSGESPFIKWLTALRDRNSHARISARLNRVKLGSLGDAKALGDGVYELKIDYGPGYRVYFGWDGKVLVILLGGGTKKRQQSDIQTAFHH